MFLYSFVTGMIPVVLSDSRSCYIVFESALLVLFTFCGSKSVNIKKLISGSFLRITQKCLRCHWDWTHWKCTCRQHLYLCCYPLCGSIASPSSSDFQNLELSHHLVQYILPTPKAVLSTSHIYHLEKPTISIDIQFERSEEEVVILWRWQS